MPQWSATAAAMTVPMLLFLAVAGAPQAAAQGAQDAIRERDRAFAETFNRGDAATLTQFYTDTATAMPPDRPTVKGREAIHAFWDAVLKAGTTGLTITPTDITVTGDIAQEVSDLTVTLAGNKPASGRHILLWRRDRDGTWRIAHDLWNFTAPRQ